MEGEALRHGVSRPRLLALDDEGDAAVELAVIGCRGLRPGRPVADGAQAVGRHAALLEQALHVVGARLGELLVAPRLARRVDVSLDLDALARAALVHGARDHLEYGELRRLHARAALVEHVPAQARLAEARGALGGVPGSSERAGTPAPWASTRASARSGRWMRGCMGSPLRGASSGPDRRGLGPPSTWKTLPVTQAAAGEAR